MTKPAMLIVAVPLAVAMVVGLKLGVARTHQRSAEPSPTEELIRGLEERDALIRSLRGTFVVEWTYNTDPEFLSRTAARPDMAREIAGSIPPRTDVTAAFEGRKFLQRALIHERNGTTREELIFSDAKKAYYLLPPGSQFSAHAYDLSDLASKDRQWDAARAAFDPRRAGGALWRLDVAHRTFASFTRPIVWLEGELAEYGAKVAAKERIAGVLCYRLSAQTANRKDPSLGSVTYTWWISPQRTFGLVKGVSESRKHSQQGLPDHTVRQVTETAGWKQFSRDVWLPQEITFTTTATFPDGRTFEGMRIRQRATSMSVNRRLDPKIFAPAQVLPPSASVLDRHTGFSLTP